MSKTAPESVAQAAILQWSKLQKGILLWRQNTGGTRREHKGKARYIQFSVRGAADLTGLIDGRRLEVEVKRDGAAQTPAQVHFQKMIELHGGLYVLAYNLQDFQAAVRIARGIE